MDDKVRIAGVEEARTKLPSLLRAANHNGEVTVITKRGVPYAAIVPVSNALVGGRSSAPYAVPPRVAMGRLASS